MLGDNSAPHRRGDEHYASYDDPAAAHHLLYLPAAWPWPRSKRTS